MMDCDETMRFSGKGLLLISLSGKVAPAELRLKQITATSGVPEAREVN